MRTLTIICILLFSVLVGSAYPVPLNLDNIRQKESVLPFMDWLPDENGQFTLEDVASSNLQHRFKSLKNGFPVYSIGPVWLRITLTKSNTRNSSSEDKYSLNLGKLPAGDASIYLYGGSGSLLTHNQWHSQKIKDDENIILPSIGNTPVQIFIKFSETPSLWFSPTITPQKLVSPPSFPLDYILPSLLILGAVVCALRGIKTRDFAGAWSALLLLANAGAFLSPYPLLSNPPGIENIPLLITPGLSVLLIPHLGRMILKTSKTAPLQDGLFAAYSLVGVALALAPLFPGLSWLVRLFPLWAILLSPLVPLCIWGLGRKISGGLAFTGLCIMPLIGSCIAVSTIGSSDIHSLPALASQWGLAIAGLGLAFGIGKKEAPEIPEKILEIVEAQKDAFKINELANNLMGREPLFGDSHPSKETSIPEILSSSSSNPPKASSFEEKSVPKKSAFVYPPISEEPPKDIPLAMSGKKPELENVEHSNSTNNANNSSSSLSLDLNNSSVNSKDINSSKDADSSSKDADSSSNLANISASTLNENTSAKEDINVTNSNKSTLEQSTDLKDNNASINEQENTFKSEPIKAKSVSNEESPSYTLEAFENIYGKSAKKTSDESSNLPYIENLERIVNSQKHSAPEPKVISLEDDSIDKFDYEQFKEQIPLPLPDMPLPRKEQISFSLTTLLQEVHYIISPLAQRKGLLFSWFAAPSVPSIVTGDEERLRQTLLLLLHNAVEATTRGAVQLSVRPASTIDPYHVIFSINDSGSSQRTDVGYFHAWEIASKTGGTFSVKYSSTHGPLVSFSVHFSKPIANSESSDNLNQVELGQVSSVSYNKDTNSIKESALKSDNNYQTFISEFATIPSEGNLERKHQDKDLATIVLGDMTTSNRRLLGYYLESLPVSIINATHVTSIFPSLDEKKNILFIFDGDSIESVILSEIAEIFQAKRLGKFDINAKVLVIASHNEQEKRMLQNGCDYIISKPFTPESLKSVILKSFPSILNKNTAQESLNKNNEAEKVQSNQITSLNANTMGAYSINSSELNATSRTNAEALNESALNSSHFMDSNTSSSNVSTANISYLDEPSAHAQANNTLTAAENLQSISTVDENLVHTKASHESANNSEQNAQSNSSHMPSATINNTTNNGSVLEELNSVEQNNANSSAPQATKTSEENPELQAKSHQVQDTNQHNSTQTPKAEIEVEQIPVQPVANHNSQQSTNTAQNNISQGSSIVATTHTGNLAGNQQLSNASEPSASSAYAHSHKTNIHAEEANRPSSFSTNSLIDFIITDEEKNGQPVSSNNSQKIEGNIFKLDLSTKESIKNEKEANNKISNNQPRTIVVNVPRRVSANNQKENNQGQNNIASNNNISIVQGSISSPSAANANQLDIQNSSSNFLNQAEHNNNVPNQNNTTSFNNSGNMNTQNPANSHVNSNLNNVPLQDNATNNISESAVDNNPKKIVSGLPLKGMEEEEIEKTLIPLIPGLIQELKDILLEINNNIDSKELSLVQESTKRLASKAEVFNLIKLRKVAYCVERAAEARDLEAVTTLADDLVIITQRYIDCLQQSYSTMF